MKHKSRRSEHDEPSDMIAGFKAMDEHRKEVNADSLKSNTFRLKGACQCLKIEAKKLTEYHYRIGGDTSPPLDIYPTNLKYHNHKTGNRGTISGSMTDFLKSELGIKP